MSDFETTVVDLLSQGVAAILMVGQNVRMGPIPGGVPFDKTTLAYKDYNLEGSITHKEFLGYEIAGNHPAGVVDPQWAQGFPLWPSTGGGTGSGLGPVQAALTGVPPSAIQALITALTTAIGPVVAANPTLGPLMTALMPLLQGLLSGGGGGAMPAPGTPVPVKTGP